MARQVWKWEPSPRWVRVFHNGRKVADSKRTMLLIEGGPDINYYFPKEDVDMGALVKSKHTATSGYRGTRRFWHIEVYGKRAENAASTYDPKKNRPDLSDFIAFDWHKVDKIMEEEEQVYNHARSPYHRVDTVPSSRHVEVFVDGVKVADTTRPHLLFETSLPTRYYVPEEDVNHDYLEESDTHSVCPYKGVASYYHIVVNGTRLEDTVWYYPDPIPESPRLKGHLAFWPEKDKRRIKIVIDGEVV